ncbi:hypothetical protein AOC36_07435 [Erysipelothrix larvae]|uniref:HTH hxlR-type domain-containing protein n=1 Tax=Erysipelothrix larvae TaxID=1514105 RepID=A0A0X8H0I8_9FIRM|nr:helix-turn-helix domain-containing protein [Erysipelothrix larvae]AMC93821.1 hypothetical protein AOC36_07435 [Erysipelothrix larvae]
MTIYEKGPVCPVATTVNLIGSKWKLLILRELLTKTMRFKELERNIEGISQKMLTQDLRKLEQDGIVIRTVYAEVPPRVEYSLSELGETLRPIIHELRSWGLDYLELEKTQNVPNSK